MNIFIVFLIAHIQTHRFVNVSSGVEGIVIEQTASRQESRTIAPMVTADKTTSKGSSKTASKDDSGVTMLPSESPAPIQQRPVYVGDKFCGIPWPDSIERYNNCMTSPEREAYMARKK